MQKIKFILLVTLVPFTIKAQVIFKTIAPQQVVVAGESFPVQYVLEDIEKDDGFIPPFFKGFRQVSGPYTYGGVVYGPDGSKRLKNIIYTLVATKPGRYIIAGASAKVKGKFIKSGSAVIDVISKAEAFEKNANQRNEQTASEYFMQPGEDPYEKMRENLFMKVMVDKRSCYVGQPVTATFKLYSRLESKSDIVKNPGFYGFTVQDIISLHDNIATIEKVNGKPFDVHTVRTVQLYPLQAGIFTIDAMEVMNKVEFSKSADSRKTEQEIIEGVFENNDPPGNDDNTVRYENSISTEKIMIHVKPYPDAKKPMAFNGATGKFSVHASLEKNELAKNEEGAFIITITGKGNFTQLSAPVVQWPSGIEGFDPVIKDSLDKTQAPLKGSRTFRFPFIAGKAGSYNIPAISFTFFDPDSNNYKTVSAATPEVKISNEEKEMVRAFEEPNRRHIKNPALTRHTKKPALTLWAAAAILILSAMALLWFITRRRKKETISKSPLPETVIPVRIDELLQPAQFALKADDGQFYSLLQKGIRAHLSTRLQLSGSKMNKDDLRIAMKEKNLDEDQCRNILDILQQCEAAVFTKVEFADDKQELLNRTKMALEQIKV
jgi:BatD DUF11 like domain